MLPTLAVILWAYGMYALFSFMFQRKGGQSAVKAVGASLPGLPWWGGIVGVGLILWCCLSPDKHDQRLKLAGFLGTVYAEGWPDRVDKVEYPPVKSPNQGAGEQPAYALLHPETPTSQIEPEKKLIRPRPSRAATKRHSRASMKSPAKPPRLPKPRPPRPRRTKWRPRAAPRKRNGLLPREAGRPMPVRAPGSAPRLQAVPQPL